MNADTADVQFERLVLESGENRISFDLHPQLTIIAGLSQMERDGLVNEFVGALGSSRSGVHLELLTGNGKRFAIFRPNTSTHRVIDVDDQLDVTEQFTDAAGTINLLSRVGLDHHRARKAMRFNAQDLEESASRDELIQQLARVDQQQLWLAAEILRTAQLRLKDEADSLGSSVEDAEVIERIETQHENFERSQEQSEKVRRATFMVAGFAALLSVPMARLAGTLGVMPLAAIACTAVMVSIVYWRRLESARKREAAALAAAGAHSYLGFHLQRVNSLLISDSGRRRLITAAEEHRDAAMRWAALAGSADLEWADQNHEEISAASKLRQQIHPASGHQNQHALDDTAATAHALVTHLGQLRNLAASGESFPALLDEPFINIESGVLPELLEVMVRGSQHQQIILMTDSPSLTSWAQLEQLTGALTIIEPSTILNSAMRHSGSSCL
ncbi:MAG: hypothetical protein WD029_02270 [Microthrixaceae bacterium]